MRTSLQTGLIDLERGSGLTSPITQILEQKIQITERQKHEVQMRF